MLVTGISVWLQVFSRINLAHEISGISCMASGGALLEVLPSIEVPQTWFPILTVASKQLPFAISLLEPGEIY